MKSRELMIGDWVKNAHSKKFEIIERVHPFSVETEESGKVFEEDIIPIPITPEILEQNEFIKYKTIDREGWILQGITYNIKMEQQLSFWSVRITSLENDGECDTTVRYVHRLQHLMRDFLIWKEIEL